jgi:hypothetical protein
MWRVHFRQIVTKIEYISEHEKKSLVPKIYYTDIKRGNPMRYFSFFLGCGLQPLM